MAGWHHFPAKKQSSSDFMAAVSICNGHELGQTLGDGGGQGGLVCCSPWGCKTSDMTGKHSVKVASCTFLH